jgi:hypothetical protein
VCFSTSSPHTYSTPAPAPLRHHRRHHPGSEPEPLSIPCCWWLPMPGFSVVSLSCQARITQSIKLVCESSWARLIPRIDTDASHSGMASLPLCHASISASTDACNGRLLYQSSNSKKATESSVQAALMHVQLYSAPSCTGTTMPLLPTTNTTGCASRPLHAFAWQESSRSTIIHFKQHSCFMHM